MKHLRRIIIAILIILLAAGGLFYLRNQVYNAHGTSQGDVSFEIKKGEGSEEISERLYEAGLVSGKYYFFYYIRANDLQAKIMPGVYELSGRMTIPEIAHIITNQEEQFIKITFPEGWDARKMAQRLNENGLDGNGFLVIAQKPGEMKKRYSYLSSEKLVTLEGFLFPDTYYFKKDTEAKDIIGRLLDNFDEKLTDAMRQSISAHNRTINDVVIMASLAEREVQTPEDMKIVSGIFWKRLQNGQKLESDATLSYVLDDKEDQHSGDDLALDSPYNSYRYAGLPPTPIGNPGMNALRAAIEPQESTYNFFFTTIEDGVKKVIFSATFEEHVANRKKYGV